MSLSVIPQHEFPSQFQDMKQRLGVSYKDKITESKTGSPRLEKLGQLYTKLHDILADPKNIPDEILDNLPHMFNYLGNCMAAAEKGGHDDELLQALRETHGYADNAQIHNAMLDNFFRTVDAADTFSRQYVQQNWIVNALYCAHHFEAASTETATQKTAEWIEKSPGLWEHPSLQLPRVSASVLRFLCENRTGKTVQSYDHRIIAQTERNSALMIAFQENGDMAQALFVMGNTPRDPYLLINGGPALSIRYYENNDLQYPGPLQCARDVTLPTVLDYCTRPDENTRGIEGKEQLGDILQQTWDFIRKTQHDIRRAHKRRLT